MDSSSILFPQPQRILKEEPKRIHSIDVLRGLVMVLMALDHTRDFLHKDALFYQVTDLETVTPLVFFTRWVTHFCAPAFVFLSGISAYLSGQKKTLNQLSAFLIKRGLWLIWLEITVINFAFWFDITFMNTELQVMWAIGVSMIVISGLIFLPKSLIAAISLTITFGHNLLDSDLFEDFSATVFGSVLHQQQVVSLVNAHQVSILYPVLPWIGLMALGYCFGPLFTKKYDPGRRIKILRWSGMGALFMFFVIRFVNIYGDPGPWGPWPTTLYTMMSFLNVAKYPPSLLYLLMTMSPVLLLLAALESRNMQPLYFLTVYGRTALFYYVLHFYFIRIMSVANLLFQGKAWKDINFQNGTGGIEPGDGVVLGSVYMIWLLVLLILYPLCRWYGNFKSQKSGELWSYL